MPEPRDGIDVLAHRLTEAERKIKELEAELEKRASEEKARLVWGIIFLGGIVSTLVKIIWDWRAVILRGPP